MSHWPGCDGGIVAIDGRGSYCRCCGAAITTKPLLAGKIVAEKNEDPVSATNAPGPLDADKERRNG